MRFLLAALTWLATAATVLLAGVGLRVAGTPEPVCFVFVFLGGLWAWASAGVVLRAQVAPKHP